MFTDEQIEQYETQGFLVLRRQFSEPELQRLDEVAVRFPPLDDGKPVATYPAPGRYTLAKSSWADPAFVYFAEHPVIVNGAKSLLRDEVHLTAYVMYDRTPGGKGIPAHHVAPGSHLLDRVEDKQEGALHVGPAKVPVDNDFIDPQLKRGDLLFMNMHLWHKAADNKSDQHRLGLFNKYAARHCPPATGYYVYSEEVCNLFSDPGKNLLAVHSNRSIQTTRLLLQRQRGGQNEFFFVNEDNGLALPGGPVAFEDAIPDWDIGNYIGALADNVRQQIRIETPWVSYVGDYLEADYLCRIYAYPMNQNGFPVPYHEGQWVPQSDLGAQKFAFGYEPSVVDDWLDPGTIRGKGLSQAQSRVDQFAY